MFMARLALHASIICIYLKLHLFSTLSFPRYQYQGTDKTTRDISANLNDFVFQQIQLLKTRSAKQHISIRIRVSIY